MPPRINSADPDVPVTTAAAGTAGQTGATGNAAAVQRTQDTSANVLEELLLMSDNEQDAVKKARIDQMINNVRDRANEILKASKVLISGTEATELFETSSEGVVNYSQIQKTLDFSRIRDAIQVIAKENEKQQTSMQRLVHSKVVNLVGEEMRSYKADTRSTEPPHTASPSPQEPPSSEPEPDHAEPGSPFAPNAHAEKPQTWWDRLKNAYLRGDENQKSSGNEQNIFVMAQNAAEKYGDKKIMTVANYAGYVSPWNKRFYVDAIPAGWNKTKAFLSVFNIFSENFWLWGGKKSGAKDDHHDAHHH